MIKRIIQTVAIISLSVMQLVFLFPENIKTEVRAVETIEENVTVLLGDEVVVRKLEEGQWLSTHGYSNDNALIYQDDNWTLKIRGDKLGTTDIYVQFDEVHYLYHVTIVDGFVQTNKKGKWFKLYDGSMLKNAWRTENGKKYYFGNDGYACKGWKKISGKWYHFDQNSYMQTGWLKDAGKWYYFKSNGVMATGWVKDSGKWYYMNGSGVMQKSKWFKEKNSWYYLQSSGAAAVGWKKLGGKWYYFNSNTKMATGWFMDNGKWYYSDKKTGAMKTGWIKQGKHWYYLKGSGAMAQNTKIKINGTTYEFLPSGVMYDRDLILKTANKYVGKEGSCEYIAWWFTGETMKMGGNSYSMEWGMGHKIKASQARPGDLILYRHKTGGYVPHVAVLLDGYNSLQGNFDGKTVLFDYRRIEHYTSGRCDIEFWRIDEDLPGY